MKYFVQIALLWMSFCSASVFAHGNHSHHSIDAKGAMDIGSKVANHLSVRDAGLGFGKLPKTWASLTADSFAIHKQGPGYFVVAVNNPTESKVMYVFMSAGGNVYDVNFTGEFDGIK